MSYVISRMNRFGLSTLCAFGSFAGPAGAQDANDAVLEEIIVSAQKRTESLKDVPISISVYTGEEIARSRIESLQDYMQQTPNVSFNNGGTSASYDMGIRGVSNIGGASNVFGVYVDEFNVAPGSINATFDQRLLDVERLEVLRGPQGTFFGRNVSGGAINITTRKPQNRFEAQALAEIANHDSYLARGSLNVPLSDNRVLMRASAYGESYGGFLKNDGPSNATNDREQYGGRLALRFLPTERVTGDLSVSYTTLDQGFPNFVPSGTLDSVLASFGLQPFPLTAGFYPDNVKHIETNLGRRTKADTLIASGRLEYAGEGFSVVSVTGYIDSETTFKGESDYTAYDMYFDDSFNNLNSWSTELRAQSNTHSPWQWMIGAIYAKDDIDVFTNRSFGPDWFHVLLGLPQGFPIPPDVSVINDLRTQNIATYGLFGEMSWTGLADKLKVSLSGRWQRDEIDQSYYAPRQSPFPPFPSTLDDFSGSANFSSFMPRLAATYKLSEQVTGYGVVAKGVKPGGYNLGSEEVVGSPATYNPEELWNYEVGLKGEFLDRRLRLDLAAFLMDWNQIQVGQFFFDPDTLSGVDLTANGTSAQSKGMELGFLLAATSRLRFSGSVGYTDATFDDYPNAIVGANGQTADLTGNMLPLSTKWTVNANAEYRQPVAGSTEVFGRVEFVYRGDTYDDIQNRDIEGELIPSYHVWNLRVGMERDRYSLIAFVDNVTNDDYVSGWLADSSLSGVLAVVNPRTFGLRFMARFD